MRKLLFVFIIIVFGVTVRAQSAFYVGGNLGIPVGGDKKDDSTIGFELQLEGLSQVSKNIRVGLGASYLYYLGKERVVAGIKQGKNSSYSLPVYGSARLDILLLTLGTDLGYAFGLSNADSGVYGKLLVGARLGNIMVQLFTSGTEARVMSGIGVVVSL